MIADACVTPTGLALCSGVEQLETDDMVFTWSGSCSEHYVEYWPLADLQRRRNSGWVVGASWNAGWLDCGQYQWRVKGKNSVGQHTPWSSVCNFAVVAVGCPTASVSTCSPVFPPVSIGEHYDRTSYIRETSCSCCEDLVIWELRIYGPNADDFRITDPAPVRLPQGGPLS